MSHRNRADLSGLPHLIVIEHSNRCQFVGVEERRGVKKEPNLVSCSDLSAVRCPGLGSGFARRLTSGSRTRAGHRPAETGQGHGPDLAFAEVIAPIGRQVHETIDLSRRPTDLDPLDPLGRSQAEMKPGIAGGG